MKKGISPLIATVLLVAFTIAIGLLFLGFSNQFTREQISETKETGKSTINCGNAAIEIFGVTANSSDLIVNTRNIGSHDFTDLSLIIQNTSASALMTIDVNDTLADGATKSVIVDSWGTQSVYEVTVNTDCPGIYSTVRNESGTFKEVF